MTTIEEVATELRCVRDIVAKHDTMIIAQALSLKAIEATHGTDTGIKIAAKSVTEYVLFAIAILQSITLLVVFFRTV